MRRHFRSISMMGFGGSSPGGDASSFSFDFDDGFRKMFRLCGSAFRDFFIPNQIFHYNLF